MPPSWKRGKDLKNKCIFQSKPLNSHHFRRWVFAPCTQQLESHGWVYGLSTIKIHALCLLTVWSKIAAVCTGRQQTAHTRNPSLEVSVSFTVAETQVPAHCTRERLNYCGESKWNLKREKAWYKVLAPSTSPFILAMPNKWAAALLFNCKTFLVSSIDAHANLKLQPSANMND